MLRRQLAWQLVLPAAHSSRPGMISFITCNGGVGKAKEGVSREEELCMKVQHDLDNINEKPITD